MEEALRQRVTMRRARLMEKMESVQTECAAGIKELTIKHHIASLKELLDKLDGETKYYIKNSQNPDQSVANECFEQQMAAEDMMDALSKHLQMETTPASTSTTKLPKLELPKFDGNQTKWCEFWDKFRGNVDQKQIPDVDKLSYLVSCLEGVALQAVAGLPTTEDNYQIALDTLKGRFGSTTIQIDSHYVALNNIPRAQQSSGDCRTTLDNIEHHLRILEQLGEPGNGNHLRSLVLSKFPEQVIHELHLIGTDDNMATIRANLDRIILAMERSAILRPGNSSSAVGIKEPTDNDLSSATTGTLHAAVQSSKPRRHRRKADGHHERGQSKKRQGTHDNKHEPPRKKGRACLFCDLRNHSSADCRRVKTIEERKDKLQGRCLNCLSLNHKSEKCSKRISCFRCNEDHLMMFCPKPATKGEENCNNNEFSKVICNLSYCTYLQTAVGKIKNPSKTSRLMIIRLLLDSGSQRSYITKKTAKFLELINMKEDLLLIYTFGATNPKETLSPVSEIIIETKRGITRKLQVNIVDRITSKIPVANFFNKSVDILADDESTGEGIDLLIGNDYYCSFMRDEKIVLSPNLYLVNTDFGWILSGNTNVNEETSALTVTTYCQCHIPSCPYFAEPDLPLRNIDVNFLWSLESIGITDNPKSTRQEEAVKHFTETVQYQNGRYYVKWPWIQYPPELSSNFGLAIGRLKSLLKRIDKDALLEYDCILKEQLQSGIIEEINPKLHQTSNQPVHYLPHHMVKQKGKRGRLVYDASAKTSGQKSLNECLYSGPSFLEDLTALLLKFRMKKIGVMADVEKAFLQVGLQEEDRDVTRFLWIKDLNKEPRNDNLMYLRFCRVPFGIISSPMLLTATIRHHMMLSSSGDLLKNIANKCYVDNLVTSADSVQEARQIYEQTRETFVQLGMNIRDWVSNDKELMSVIPQAHQAEQQENVKVLGLSWNTTKDTLKLKVSTDNLNQDPSTNTKRTVLRDMARIYDPLGFVCPLVLPMKLLFQRICKMKLKWDAELPDDLKQMLKEDLDCLKQIQDVELPRHVGIESPDATYQAHAFTDASKNAFSCVVYLRGQSGQNITVSFIMGKCRISRIEDKDELKIPRLELLGFLIGSRMLAYVKSNIDHPIENEYLWTDSLVVLGWMNSNKLLPPFVANRVNEIKKRHPKTEMCYINTKSNPADVATRPELWKEKQTLWFSGPDFLRAPETTWPENRHYATHHALVSLGEAQIEVCPGERNDPTEKGLDRLTVLPISGCIPEDIKNIQRKYYPEELAGRRTHLSRNLDLFLDVDGVIRCRGRMANTTWTYDKKYPILLPRDSDFTKRIITETHEKNYHVGAAHTLSIIRERYWIPQGKSQVQKIIRRCLQCTKHGGGPYKLPYTPALPPERVNYSNPFTFTGVDYFGPMLVNTPTGKEKRWVALFTCLAVRAIHLEIVNDLSAEECLLALRRFAATRGVPKRMYSDNATCFKLTSEVMTKPFCIDNKIEWRFIPQLAPWHGGFYERLVALVKHCLKRTLEKHLLNDSKLLTVIKEIEAVVNSRPITQTGTELEHTLRPADFLSLQDCLMTDPTSVESPPEGTSAKIDLIQSWKRGLKIIEEFKRMFIRQYLMTLRERSKHLPKQPRIKSHRSPTIGDVVQIWSNSKNREFWKTGKIIALIKGSDNECRVAKVKTKDSVLTRSIGHLYPLEADSDERGTDEQGRNPEQVSKNSEMAGRADFEAPGEFQEVIDTPQTQENTDPPHEEMAQREVNKPPDEPEPMDVDSGPPQDDELESTKNEGDEAVDTEQDTPAARDEVLVPHAVDGALRSRRDAAVRASERIREWTRHLLTLLQ